MSGLRRWIWGERGIFPLVNDEWRIVRERELMFKADL